VIVDSSALIAVILQEGDQERFIDAMLVHGGPSMSAANWLEVAMVMDSHKLPSSRIRFEEMIDEFRIKVLPVTAEIAVRARHAHNQFGRGQHPAKLNYGDCFAYATAVVLGQPLLFKGNDFSQTDILPALKD
jgi:ribonuclease VapC